MKVAIALVLIVGLKQLFLGAILALVVSASGASFILPVDFTDEFKQKTNWGYLKEWIKGSAGNRLQQHRRATDFFCVGPAVSVRRVKHASLLPSCLHLHERHQFSASLAFRVVS